MWLSDVFLPKPSSVVFGNSKPARRFLTPQC